MAFAYYPTAWEIAEIEQLRPRERLVLLAIVEHADDNGMCFPSHRRLARYTGLSVRTVGSALSGLQTKEFIFRERRGNSRGGRSSDLLRLLIPKAAKPAGKPPGGVPKRGVTGKSAQEKPEEIADVSGQGNHYVTEEGSGRNNGEVAVSLALGCDKRAGQLPHDGRSASPAQGFGS